MCSGVDNSFRVSGSGVPSWTLSGCRPIPCGILSSSRTSVLVECVEPRAVTLVTICFLSEVTCSFEASSGGVVTFVHSLDINAFHLVQKTSQKTVGAQERNAFDRLFGGRVPVGTGKAEGSVHCPRAPTPEPSKGRRPQNRHSQKRNVHRPWSPVSCLSCLAGLGVLSRARVSGPFTGSLRVSVCLFLFFLFLFIDRGRHVPAPRWEGRRVKRQGADPRTGTGHRPKDRLFQVPPFAGGFAVL